MRKLAKLSFIILIPIVLGGILTAAGFFTADETVSVIGFWVLAAGIPAVMVVLITVGLVLIITGRLNLDDSKKADKSSQPETEKRKATDEENDIRKVNSSYRYESRYASAKYQANHISKIYKLSNLGDRIKGWLFFLFLIIDFVLILVFAFLGITLGAIICFCLFAGTILICFLVKIVLEKTSISGKHKPSKYFSKMGEVLATVLSSMTSTGTKYTERIKSVTYRVIIKVDGKTYNAYSKNFYKEGETVEVLIKRNGKGNAIIQSPPKSETSSDNK